jgi:Tfp pilus assembly protein PilF
MSSRQLQRTIDGAVEHLGDVSRSAAKGFDNARYAAAHVVASTASSLRKVGHAADGISERADTRLQRIARYLRRNDSNDMARSLKIAMQRHPAKFAVGALAGIFLIRHFLSDKTES